MRIATKWVSRREGKRKNHYYWVGVINKMYEIKKKNDIE